MGIYGDFSWGTGSAFDVGTGENQPFGSTSDDIRYGQASRLQFSALPARALAIDYDKIQITWSQPEGELSKIRIVRSFDGFAETAEDGIIIWEWDSLVNTPRITNIIDGDTYPLPSGKFVYYRWWVLTNAGVWTLAGDTYALVPAKHAQYAPDGSEIASTHQKVMDLIPRVFTSATQSPIDEADQTSDFYKFMKAFSFTLDVSMTYADLLLPKESGRYVSPEVLMLQTLQLGLTPEPFLATKRQRALTREALYFYQNKGTIKGLASFVEALTGFSPDVTVSPNLVLSPQDSSFTDGVGLWRPVGDLQLSVENTIPSVANTVEPFVNDYGYVGKVVVNTVGATAATSPRIISGIANPITQGTPVKAGVPYTFSGYGKAVGDSMGLYAYAHWYDYKGDLIRVDPPLTFPVSPTIVPTADWSRFEFVGRAPGVEQAIVNITIASSFATITLDSYNVLLPSETIQISGVKYPTSVIPDDVDRAAVEAAINTGHQITSGTADGVNRQIQVYLPGAPDIVQTEVGGKIQEAYPALDTPTLLPVSGNVTSNVATVVFGTAHGLVDNDVILIQGFDPIFSYGLHLITKINDTTISFALTHSDETFTLATPPTYGFVKKVLPGNATPFKKATYAGFELVFLSTGTMYMDLMQMATYDVQEYHEARAAEIFLNPTKSNFLKNPGFNPTGIASWTFNTPTTPTEVLSSSDADLEVVGTRYVLSMDTHPALTMATYSVTDDVAVITLTGTHPLVAGDKIFIAGIAPGIMDGEHVITDTDTNTLSFDFVSSDISTTVYPAVVGIVAVESISAVIPTGKFTTSSVYVRTPKDSGDEEQLLLVAIAYDGVSNEVVASSYTPFVANDTWQRVSTTTFVPERDNPTVVLVFHVVSIGTGTPTVYLDRAQVETSFTATDYLDGSLDPTLGAVWEAYPYDSSSHLYPNLPIKITRLRQELPNYLPVNTSYLIRWYGYSAPGVPNVAKPIE
jgi:hypothetical protein